MEPLFSNSKSACFFLMFFLFLLGKISGIEASSIWHFNKDFTTIQQSISDQSPSNIPLWLEEVVEQEKRLSKRNDMIPACGPFVTYRSFKSLFPENELCNSSANQHLGYGLLPLFIQYCSIKVPFVLS